MASLARPGGNVTGLSTLTPELGGKRLQLVKKVGVSRVVILWNAANPYTVAIVRETEAAARMLGVQVQSLEVRGPDDFDFWGSAQFFSAISRRIILAMARICVSLV